MQNLERHAHGVVQAGVDRREHRHALLDHRERGADRDVGVLVGKLFVGRANDATSGLGHEAQQLIEHGVRRVEGDRHGDLAHVIDANATLDLRHLCRLDPVRLAAARPALELQHAGEVVDVRRVQKRPQRACGRR